MFKYIWPFPLLAKPNRQANNWFKRESHFLFPPNVNLFYFLCAL